MLVLVLVLILETLFVDGDTLAPGLEKGDTLVPSFVDGMLVPAPVAAVALLVEIPAFVFDKITAAGGASVFDAPDVAVWLEPVLESPKPVIEPPVVLPAVLVTEPPAVPPNAPLPVALEEPPAASEPPKPVPNTPAVPEPELPPEPLD